MRGKILGIFVCMLLIAAAIPAVTSKNKNMINSIGPVNQQTSMAEDWIAIEKIFASDGEESDQFGYSVSLDGDTAVIGAYADDSWRGSAYVFTCTETIWMQQAKLLASDGATDDLFGCAVSLSGDTALIGAYGDDSARGSAYVFTYTGTSWKKQAKLLASDGEEGDVFGLSVSLSGDTAVIGAPGDDDMGPVSGSAYVFTRTGTSWTQQAKLLASDGAGAGAQFFGDSVSLSEDTALIGAKLDDLSRGSAYVFTRTGTSWTQQAKLLASDGASNDEFGYSVSLSGDTAVIGAPEDDSDRGSAYVFTRTGTIWTQQAKLLASDGTQRDDFGWSVSLDGDTLVIGAPEDDSDGAAFVFTRIGTNWTQQAKLLASDAAWHGNFGCSVSLDSDIVFIGAIRAELHHGAVYVFKKKGIGDPNSPTITGPASGKIKVAIAYNFTTIDPDGDEVSYYIDWGDNTNSGWIGPYTSGEEISQSHTWTKKGDYTIKAKAKDSNGAESGWGELPVTMPYSYNIPLQWFWERLFNWFPHAFPILRHLLGY